MEDDQKEDDLSKEEILAKSREENKNGDERDKQCLYRSAFAATLIGFVLCGIVNIVLSILDRQSYEMNMVIFATVGSMYLMWGIKTSKHRPLFLGAGSVCIAASVVALIGWILQLCGNL